MTRYFSLGMNLFLLILSCGPLFAQVRQNNDGEIARGKSALLVTAASSRDQVRFASFGLVRRMRLEVVNQAGQAVFDSGYRDGCLLDW